MQLIRSPFQPLAVLVACVACVVALPTWAADKNGVSPNAISVPSGPGSIEGLGESFEPALNNGTARYGLELELPPGPVGHTPTVRFSYDGGQGNGPLGIGWSLPVPFIQRQTDKGIPRYIDGNNGLDDDRDGQIDEADEIDVFINDAKEELVPVAGGDYFCENEQSFIRYRRVGDHWEGTMPDGTRMEFGLTVNGRIVDSATNHVFKWLLERQTDTHGNTILYTWTSFPGATNLHQKYLAEIRYGAGAAPWTHFHFAAFNYETRADWFEDGRSGFLVRTARRLQEVTIGTQGSAPAGHATGDFNADGTADVLNRKYRLNYLADAPGSASLLQTVTQVGADGVTTLPPARFGYSVGRPAEIISATSQFIGGTNEPLFAMDNANVDLVDLNGDGLPDLLRTGAAGGAHLGYLNRGEQTNATGRVIAWSAAQEISSPDGLAWGVNLQSPSDVASLVDMNGDGMADLTYKSALGDVFYFANHGSLRWGQRQFMSPQDVQPPAPFGNPNVRTADIDFDKRIDVIESISSGGGADYRIWFNLGNQRYARSITVPQTAGFLLSASGVQIADFNGDRVPDILRIQPAALTVIAGLGYGHFAPPQTVGIPDWTLDSTQIAKARLEDINGDGLVDLVIERAAPGQIWYWLNRGNYTVDARRLITGLPAGLGVNTRWADLNGNGSTDLIISDSAATPKIFTVDLGRLMGCVPAPNTLTSVENGIGEVMTFDYASSTQFALEDAATGNAWTNRLPFPVTVVSRLTTSDSLGHSYETRYRYHQGYYDAVEKEFRGFAVAEQIEIGDVTAPTLVRRSYFDTGERFESLKGRLLRLTAEQEDGKVFWDETTSWTDSPRILYSGTNGQTVKFVHPLRKTKRIHERGVGSERQLETEFAFDNFGNQTWEANYGVVIGNDRSAFDDERITTNEFALNLNAWILRAPSRTEVRDEQGVALSRTENFYDDESFSGNNFGQVQTGNVTLRRDWFHPANPAGYVNTTRTRFDAYGNGVAILDPLASAGANATDGHWREVTFDGPFHTFAVEEKVHLGNGSQPLIFAAVYDPGFGKQLLTRDYNGFETSYGYDALARLTHIVKPGDTPAFPTTEYTYQPAQAIGPGKLVNYVETRMLDKLPGTAGSKRDHYLLSRQFTDGLGRVLLTKKEAGSDAGQPRVAIHTATIFNARQKPAQTLNACYSTLTGTLDQLLEFEDVSAPGWQGTFHHQGALVSLNLASAHQRGTRYDALLREIEKANPDGTFQRTEFEPLITRVLDENDNNPASPHSGTPHVLHQDGLGRQIRTDEIVRLNDDGTPTETLKAWTTTFAYDLNDQLVRVTDSQNNVKAMVYDGLKRLLSVNDPDRGISTNYYDAASNRIETRDAKGQRNTYTFDGANRLLTEDYHDEGQPFSAGFAFNPNQPLSRANRPDVAYFYDTPVANLDLGDGTTGTPENTKGMLAYVWDLSGEEHHSYDSRRRDAYTVKRVLDPLNGRLVSYPTRQTYDAMDRIASMTYPDNDAVAYDYNDRGSLSRIRGDAIGSIFSVLDYLPSEQMRELKYGNGVQTRYDYDERLRVRTLRTAPESAPTQPYVAFGYDFDASSNIEAIHDQRPGTVAAAGSPRRDTRRFDYDDLHRLSRVRHGFGLPGDDSVENGEIRYRYDRLGNLIQQSSTIAHEEAGHSVTDLGTLSYGGAAGSSGRMGRDLPGPGAHAVSQISSQTNTFAYDGNGNVASRDGAVLTWDFKDRLVAVEDAKMRAEYRYDYRHRRICKQVIPKQVSGTNAVPDTTFYVSSAFEVRPPEQPTKYVWNGSTRIARVSGSLSNRPRVQRLRLAQGWNLVSVAVAVMNLGSQLPAAPSADGQQPVVEAAYRWVDASQTFAPITAGANLPAGTVLWLNASAPGTLALTGTFAEPAAPPAISNPGFFAWPSFDALPLAGTVPDDVLMSAFAAPLQAWQSLLPAPLRTGNIPAPLLAPGAALFVRPAQPIPVTAPDASLRIRYYHQDHLGSSSVMTDANGQLVEEIAYYPFGVVRHSFHPRTVEEPYRFTQKEQDPETGLLYFEARYLAGNVGRFVTPDPFFSEPGRLDAARFQSLLSDPQDFNLYAYVHNNPILYKDPTGLALELETEPSTLPRSVLPYNKHVLPGKVTVLSGHGAYIKADEMDIVNNKFKWKAGATKGEPGLMVVPPGTTITFYSWHGQTITDRLGGKIDQQHVDPEQFKVTYYPGERIPNYALLPPVGLHVLHSPGVKDVQVDRPTSLQELLKPGMGAVHWSACREVVGQKNSSVDAVTPTPMAKK